MKGNKNKAIKCIRGLGGKRTNVALNGELFEVKCLKYLSSKITVDGGIDKEFKINDVGKMLGGMKKEFNCRVIGMRVKKRLYEGGPVSTALYRAETWSVAVLQKKLNVIDMRCLNVIEMRCLRHEWSNAYGPSEN